VTEEKDKAAEIPSYIAVETEFLSPGNAGFVCRMRPQYSTEVNALSKDDNIKKNDECEQNDDGDNDEDDDVTAEMDSVDREALCRDIEWEMRK
jgi:hypothetical protein